MEQDDLNNLVAIFDERQSVYSQYTEEIQRMIEPTVIEAICEIFNLPIADIQVTDISLYGQDGSVGTDVEHTTMIVSCITSYATADDVPPLLEVLTADLSDDDDPTKRIVKLALPLSYVFEPKEVILHMLYSTLRDVVGDIIDEDYMVPGEIVEHSEEPSSPNEDAMQAYLGSLHNRGKIH